MAQFNLLLETVDLDDEIGHRFVVDIEFDEKIATEREYMYNEILTPIIEKQKILEANERSVYQLLEFFDKTNDDNKPKSYRCTKKSHATMFPEKLILFYLEDQKSRQNANNAIEKDFFKLMNNTNFGCDCRNSPNNAKFEPIIDEVNETTYIKKYYNLFDSKILNFLNSYVLEQGIEQNF